MKLNNLLRWKSDLFRVFVLMILSGALLYWMDVSNVVVFQASAIGIFMVGTTHLTRRVLFPRLDLQSIAIKALEGSLPAAILFASVLIFLIAVMHLPLLVLK